MDEFKFHELSSTSWGWAGQNPVASADQTGHDKCSDCDIAYQVVGQACENICGSTNASGFNACWLKCTAKPYQIVPSDRDMQELVKLTPESIQEKISLEMRKRANIPINYKMVIIFQQVRASRD